MFLTKRPQPPTDADLTVTELCWKNRQTYRRTTQEDCLIHPELASTVVQPLPSPPVARRRRPHLNGGLVLVGVVIVATLAAILAWNGFIVPWWGGKLDTWNYGQAHVSTLDANVGHNGISHFIAEFYQHEIVVIEIDTTTTHVYLLTGYLGTTSNPVITLAVVQQAGKADLEVQVENGGFARTLYNTGTAFSEEPQP